MKSPHEDPLQAGLRVTVLCDSVIDCECGTASCPQPRASGMLILCLPPPTSPKVQGSSTITCNTNLWGDLLKTAPPSPLPVMDPDLGAHWGKRIQWERGSDGDGVQWVKDHGFNELKTMEQSSFRPLSGSREENQLSIPLHWAFKVT